MANFNNIITGSFFDSVLPSFGNTRKANTPIYDNSQKMFIVEEYESKAGHRYYKGVRFCNRLVFVESVGMYHNWTYLDSLELYVFDGEKLILAQKREYDKVFRDEKTIKKESEEMLNDYFKAQAKLIQKPISCDQAERQAHQLVEECYKSLLDEDYCIQLTKIVPALESHNND